MDELQQYERRIIIGSVALLVMGIVGILTYLVVQSFNSPSRSEMVDFVREERNYLRDSITRIEASQVKLDSKLSSSIDVLEERIIKLREEIVKLNIEVGRLTYLLAKEKEKVEDSRRQ